MKKRKIAFPLPVILALVLTLITIIGVFDFYNNMKKSLSKDTAANVLSLAALSEQAISYKLDTLVSGIKSVSAYYEKNAYASDTEYYANLADTFGFDEILVAQNEAFTILNKPYKSLKFNKEFPIIDDILNGETTAGSIVYGDDNQNNIFVVGTPLYSGGKVVAAVVGVTNRNFYASIIAHQPLYGECDNAIFDAKGGVVVSNTPRISGSMTAFLDKIVFENGYTSEQFKALVADEKRGQLKYSYDGVLYYGAFTPTVIPDIFVFHAIPFLKAMSQSHQVNVRAAIILTLVTTIFVILILYIRKTAKQNTDRQAASERKIRQSYDNLVATATELRVISNNIDIGLIKSYLDENAPIQYINKKALFYLGYNKFELFSQQNRGFMSFIHIDDHILMRKHLDYLKRTNIPISFEARAIRSDMKVIWLAIRASCIYDEFGDCIGIYTMQDITGEKIAREKIEQQNLQIKLNEEKYRIATEQSDIVVFDYNVHEATIGYSANYERVFNEAPIIDGYPHSMVGAGVVFNADVGLFWKNFSECNISHCSTSFEIRLRSSYSTYIWCLMSFTPFVNEKNELVKVIGKITNISEQKLECDTLKKRANSDSLTDLYNKTAMQALIDTNLAKKSTVSSALLIIDVDDFKVINDVFGNIFGDTVLVDLSNIIRQVFCGDELLGRLSGDEFAVFIRDARDSSEITRFAKDVTSLFRRTIADGTKKYDVSCSIGIVINSQVDIDFLQLYTKADLALRYAKNKGRDTLVYYDEDTMGTVPSC